MKPLSLTQVAKFCQGEHVGVDVQVRSISIDTRTLEKGALFVALRGENFDGHDFVTQAVAGGASAVLVDCDVSVNIPYVLCADTQMALGQLAAAVQKERQQKKSVCVIALTGSNGKTTVKTMARGILSRTGSVYFNPGNRNNEIGLPLAVLDAPEDAQFDIYEMGAGKPGDIAYLTAIAPPQVALVNNIAPAHLERMGTLQGIAETKAAIYQALSDSGVGVVNADDAFAPFFTSIIGSRRSLRFGIENDADLRASSIELNADSSRFLLHTPVGNADIRLPLPGRHNVMNALAASALSLAAGASLSDVIEGLHCAEPVKGRQIAYQLRNGSVLIDDSYNANPGSVAAAIASLSDVARQEGSQAWLVLGDMAELGETAEQLHAEIGDQARQANLAGFWSVGKFSKYASLAFGEGAQHFDDQDSLILALHRALVAFDKRQNIRCLIKGSRSSAMDVVVDALLIKDKDKDKDKDKEERGHAA